MPVVHGALQGINGTVFAYGQTGSGKTYTSSGTSDDPGLTLLAVHDVFRCIGDTRDSEFLVRASYFELYNEELYDLFDPDGSGGLRIVDGAVTGPFVKGLTEEVVLNPARVMELLALGEANRHVASTNMNARSSRSHTVFRLVVESRSVPAGSGGTGGMSAVARAAVSAGALSRSGDPHHPPSSLVTGGASIVRVATLHLIDLAGSERAAKSGAEGSALKEASGINVSLLTLGLVIHKLTTGEAHIPYRDSKLTRLLATSLGGNARTSVVVCISPSASNLSESRSSLTFAARAMRVINRARVNEVAEEASLLERYRGEIERLQHALADGRQSRALLASASELAGVPEDVVDRLRTDLEGRIRVLQEQLHSVKAKDRKTSLALEDVFQLLFVFSHACGHVRCLPLILGSLWEAAHERIPPGTATRSILATVPRLPARLARLLAAGQAPVLSGTVLGEEVVDMAGLEGEGGEGEGSGVQRGRGMLSVSALRSPTLQRRARPGQPLDLTALSSSPNAPRGSPARYEPWEGEDAQPYADGVEYFSAPSGARQLRALLNVREDMGRQIRDSAEALALKQAELDAMQRRAEASEERLGEVHARAVAASELAAVDVATLKSLRDENARLQRALDQQKAEARITAREAAAAVNAADRMVGQAAAASSGLEALLQGETAARLEAEEANAQLQLSMRDVEHARGLLQKEVCALTESLLASRAETGERVAERDEARKEVAGLRATVHAVETRAAALTHECDTLRSTALDIAGVQASFQAEMEQAAAARAGLQASYDSVLAAQVETLRERDAAVQRGRDVEQELGAAKQRLAVKDAELAIQGSGKSAAEKDVLQARYASAALESRAKELEGRLLATMDEVLLLRSQAADSEAALITTKTKLEGKRAQLAEVSALLEDARSIASVSGASAEVKARRIVGLEAELRTARASVAAQQAQGAENAEDMHVQIKAVTAQVTEAQASLEAADRRAGEAEARAGEYAARANELSVKLREAVSKAATDAVAAAAACDRLQRALDTSRAEASALSTRATAGEERLAAAQPRLDALALALTTEQAEHRATSEQVAELQTALAHAQAETGAEASRAADALSKLSAKVSHASSLSAQVHTLTSTVEKLRVEHVRLNEDVDNKAALVRSLSGEHGRQLDENAALEERIGALELVQRELEAEVEAGRALCAGTAAELSAARLEGDHARASARAREAESSALLASLTARAEERGAEAAALRATAEAQHQQLEEAGSTAASRERELSAVTRALAEAEERTRDEGAQHQAEVARLHDELSRLQYGAEALLLERTRLADALDALREEMAQRVEGERSAAADAAEASQERARASLNAVLGELEAMTRSRDTTAEHLHLMEAERGNFTSRARALEEEKGRVEAKVSALQEQVMRLAQQSTELEDDADQHQERAVALEADLAQARSALHAEKDARREMETALHRAELERAAQVGLLDKAERAVQEARHALREEQTRTGTLEGECDALRAQLSLSMGGAATNQSDADVLRRELTAARLRSSELEASVGLSAQTIAALRSEVRSRVAETHAAKEASLALQQRMGVVSEEKQGAVKEASLLSAELVSTRARLQAQQRETQDARVETTRLRQELAASRAEVAGARSSRETMAAGLAGIRQDVRSATLMVGSTASPTAPLSGSASGSGTLFSPISAVGGSGGKL